MTTTIYLIRHGVTVWNKEQRLQGHQDIELNEIGIEQANNLAEYLAVYTPLSHIYASDLKRASKTAEIIANRLGLLVTLSKDLRERDMGEWTGQTIPDIHSEYPNWEEIRNLGGVFSIEKTEQLCTRIMNVLQNIIEDHKGGNIAVVSHGAAINSVLSNLTDGEHGIGKTVLQNTSISHLHFDDKWHVLSIGETPHLVNR